MRESEAIRPRPLHLGMGWFPDQPGGLNRYVRNLVTAQASSGLDVAAVVIGPASHPPRHVAVVSRGDAPLARRLAGVAVGVAAAGREADVVDAHFALYALLPVLGPLRRLPLVVHFHGPWTDEAGWAGVGGGLRSAARRAIERIVYQRAREVVVESDAFREIVVRDYGVSRWRVHVIRPGVDLDRFTPGDRGRARASVGIDADRWVALTVRRLTPRMGVDVLVDAWGNMTGNTLLLIAGDGPARAELGSRAGALAPDAIRFLGSIPDSALVACYQAADVVVVPTVALEGFGLVVLEALACGTPVVVTDSAGLPEIVRPLADDLVVPAGDADALSQRLRTAADGSRPLPGRETCRTYAGRFSWAATAVEVEAVQARARRPALRPRVVVVDHTARLSGGELALARLLGGIDAADVHVILGEEGPLAGRLEELGVSVEVMAMDERARDVHRGEVRPGRLPIGAAVLTGRYSLRLARRLRELRPDLVQTNSLKAAFFGGLAARLAGLPVIWHIRDRVAADYLPAAAVQLTRLAATQVPTAMVFNSASTRDALLGHRRPRQTVRVIPSPIDERLLSVHRRPDAAGPTVIGMVGRIAPWKGQELFLDAMAEVLRGDTLARVRGVVVGSALFGEEEYEHHVHQHARDIGIADKVTFTGFRMDIADELSRMDVLIHASLTPEPLGVVVIEAMAAGLAVVAAGAGGPAETIEDGRTGILFEPGNCQALAGAIRVLIADPERRRALGVAGRQAAVRYRVEVVAEEMLGLWREVLDRRGPRPLTHPFGATGADVRAGSAPD